MLNLTVRIQNYHEQVLNYAYYWTTTFVILNLLCFKCICTLNNLNIGADRLYGGYYPDFQSGGQWNNISIFYDEIRKACDQDNIEIIFFLDGTNPESFESHDWIIKQTRIHSKISYIYENFNPSEKAVFK